LRGQIRRLKKAGKEIGKGRRKAVADLRKGFRKAGKRLA
jgi:hypothetical protein